MSKTKLWEEYLCKLDRGDGIVIEVCGLCGNKGIVDTLKTAKLTLVGYGDSGISSSCGVKQACICPNGRAIKRKKK